MIWFPCPFGVSRVSWTRTRYYFRQIADTTRVRAKMEPTTDPAFDTASWGCTGVSTASPAAALRAYSARTGDGVVCTRPRLRIGSEPCSPAYTCVNSAPKKKIWEE